jgi:spore germination protein KC
MRMLFLPLLFLLIMLTGCWDRLELNDVSIITGIAIEKGEKAPYKLTVSSINSTEFSKTGAQGNTPSTTFSLEGNSVSELAYKMNVGLTRKQIYSHTRIMVIDEEIAREGMLEFLDFIERSGEFRNDFNLLVAKGVKASEILKIAYPLQKDPSLKIHNQIQALLDNWGGDPNVRLTDFITSLVKEGKQPVAGLITIKGDPKKGETIENNKKLSLDTIVTMDGMAVFKFDKLVGMLSLEETRAYLWTQKLKNTNLSVPCGGDEENRKYNDIRIISTTAKKETTYKEGKAKMRVKVIAESEIVGTQCTDSLSDPKTFDKYEKQVEKFVENEISRTIKKVQEEYKADIFGFGEVLNRSNHKTFKKIKANWDHVFSEGESDVHATIFIRRSGVRNDSYLKDLEKLKKESQDATSD